MKIVTNKKQEIEVTDVGASLIIENLIGKFKALLDIDDIPLIANYRWSVHQNNRSTYYLSTRSNGQKRILMHRLIMGTPKGILTDHINGNGLDNRKENLNLSTHTANGRNWHYTRGKSKYRGVYFHKATGKWTARIGSDKTNSSQHLGLFSNEEEAAIAYNETALRFYGPNAKLNIIKDT